MGYLRLNPECHLVRGRRRACLYDTFSGDMIGLHPLETRFLAETQDSRTIDECLEAYSEDERRRLSEFVAKLVERNLGRVYESPYYVKPLDRGLAGGTAAFFEPTRLGTFFLEVNQECPLACVFCSPDGLTGRGTGCGRWGDTQEQPLSQVEKLSMIAQALELGTKEIILTGGDTLLDPGWEELTRAALKAGAETVTVWTSGALPIPDHWLGVHGVRFAFQVFSFDEGTTDTIAGRPGTMRALLANLMRLKEAAVEPLLSMVVTHHNEAHHRESQAFYKQFTQSVVMRPVFPVGPASPSPTDPSGALLGYKRWFLRVNPEIVSLSKRCHLCFHSKLAVAEDGRVLPCPAGRAWVLGDVRKESLAEVLADGRHKPYWELSKQHIPACSECEFQLGCFDCRVVQGNGKSLTEVHHCAYRPDEDGVSP